MQNSIDRMFGDFAGERDELSDVDRFLEELLKPRGESGQALAVPFRVGSDAGHGPHPQAFFRLIGPTDMCLLLGAVLLEVACSLRPRRVSPLDGM